jgi:hypothetical protein
MFQLLQCQEDYVDLVFVDSMWELSFEEEWANLEVGEANQEVRAN